MSFRLKLFFFICLANTWPVVAQKKNTPQKIKSVWIDSFSVSNGQSLNKGYWYTITDVYNQGKSALEPAEIKNAYKPIAGRNGNMALAFHYDLDKGNFKWSPYVGVGLSLADTNIMRIESIKAIMYDYKGAGHAWVVQTAGVKDYAHYQRQVPSSLDTWTTQCIPISELRQPTWGRPVELDMHQLQGFQWMVMGNHKDTGSLMIDNVRLVRNIPNAPVSVKAKMEEPLPMLKFKPEGDFVRKLSDKITLATWYDFSLSAYSLSFDDGLLSQYRYAAPILEKKGLRATFYLISEVLQADTLASNTWRFGYWDHFKMLHQKGHEIGAHTATHARLTTLNDGLPSASGTLQFELSAPLKTFKKYIPKAKVHSFAYPFVDFNAHVMEQTGKYYLSARGMGNGINRSIPSQWMNLQSNMIFYSGDRTLESDQLKMQQTIQWIETNIIQQKNWGILMVHDVLPFEEAKSATDCWHPVSAETLPDLAAWLKAKNETHQMWVAPVGEVSRYITERESVSIEVSEGSDYLLLNATDSLPDALFDLPLSLELKVPDSWKKVSIFVPGIGSKEAEVKAGRIRLNVIPDRGEVKIQMVE